MSSVKRLPLSTGVWSSFLTSSRSEVLPNLSASRVSLPFSWAVMVRPCFRSVGKSFRNQPPPAKAVSFTSFANCFHYFFQLFYLFCQVFFLFFACFFEPFLTCFSCPTFLHGEAKLLSHWQHLGRRRRNATLLLVVDRQLQRGRHHQRRPAALTFEKRIFSTLFIQKTFKTTLI